MATGARYKAMTRPASPDTRGEADDGRHAWRRVWEFYEEYRWEPQEDRQRLIQDEPEPTGDRRWDTLLAALAEHLAAQDDNAAPSWTQDRFLEQWWFPFDLPSQHVEALVHAPMAFRRRGVFLSARNLEAA